MASTRYTPFESPESMLTFHSLYRDICMVLGMRFCHKCYEMHRVFFVGTKLDPRILGLTLVQFVQNKFLVRDLTI